MTTNRNSGRIGNWVLAAAAGMGLTPALLAENVTWTNAAGDRKWTTPGNWSGGNVPTAADDVTIPSAIRNNGVVVIADGARPVKSLRLADGAGLRTAKITTSAGVGVTIEAEEFIVVGAAAWISTGDGTPTAKDAGDLRIVVRGRGANPRLVNNGYVRAGHGYGGKYLAGPGNRITGGAPGALVITLVKGDLTNNGEIRAGDGGASVNAATFNGGRLAITLNDGTLNNSLYQAGPPVQGLIQGGRGGFGDTPGRGGPATVTVNGAGEKIVNRGRILGGNGGNNVVTNANLQFIYGVGEDGGNCTVTADNGATVDKPGTVNGGEAGNRGQAPNLRGKQGNSTIRTVLPARLEFTPLDGMRGRLCRIETGPGGTIVFSGNPVNHPTIEGDTQVVLDAGCAGELDFTSFNAPADLVVVDPEGLNGGDSVLLEGRVSAGPNLGSLEEILHAERITQEPTCAPACYADCDQSTGVGILDIFDFLCFQNRFAALDPYACDCDRSSGPGQCDIFDFLCFQNAYAAGCR